MIEVFRCCVTQVAYLRKVQSPSLDRRMYSVLKQGPQALAS